MVEVSNEFPDMGLRRPPNLRYLVSTPTFPHGYSWGIEKDSVNQWVYSLDSGHVCKWQGTSDIVLLPVPEPTPDTDSGLSLMKVFTRVLFKVTRGDRETWSRWNKSFTFSITIWVIKIKMDKQVQGVKDWDLHYSHIETSVPSHDEWHK